MVWNHTFEGAVGSAFPLYIYMVRRWEYVWVMAGRHVHFQASMFSFVVDAHRGCTSQEELLVLCLVVLFYLFLSTYN